MENALHLDFKPQDEISDTLSTSAASYAYQCDETSPSNVHSTNSLEEETASKSKKIRKKRNAYQKIDDDIRLRLLEAVQRGETLKSAAKRYQVNYSSAKSIFHIYRKEGRILKKATTEKGFGFDFPTNPQPEMQSQLPPNQSQSQNNMLNLNQKPGFSQYAQFAELKSNMFHNLEEKSGSSSPLNNLVDNFSDLLRIGNTQANQRPNKNHMPFQPSRFNPLSQSPTHSLFKMQTNQAINQHNPFTQLTQLNQINQMSPINQLNHSINQLSQLNQLNQIAQITLATKPPVGGSPAEKLKQFDGFYMNYSNSPLSGNAKMMKEGSENGSSRYQKNEFDSFSEMVNAMQQSKHLTESLKKNDVTPKIHVPVTQIQQQQSFDCKMNEEEGGWNGNLESAAFDTYKSFLDAQVALSNAYKKASYLNNFVQIQKTGTGGSPSSKFLSFQGN